MKKVLFVMDTMGYGGAEKALVNLANNLDKTKYDVSVLSMFDVKANEQFLDPDIKYRAVLKHYFRGNSVIIKCIPRTWLYRFFVKGKYDIIAAYLEGSATRVVSGCTDENTKTAAWLHIEMPEARLLYKHYRSKAECVRAYKSFDAVAGVSKDVIKCFTRHTGINDNVYVKYNTINTDLINERKHERIDLGEGINIVSVARLVPQKGFDRLLRIHKRLMDEGCSYHLHIVGEGGERRMMERYIAENDLGGSVTLHGFCDNPYKYVNAADVFVSASYKEGFSTAVTEAVIIGTPVVATECSGMKEILGEDNEYGIVTENSDEGLYRGMKVMLDDPELITRYRESSKERARLFDKKKTVKEVEEMFDAL